MNLREIVRELRENADALEGIQSGFNLPNFSGGNVAEAAKRLNVAFPGITVSLGTPRIIYHDHLGKWVMADEWTVYVHGITPGKDVTVFAGKTLPDAVNAALAFLQPPIADPVGEVDRALAAF